MFFKRFQRWLRNRRFQQFREWYQLHEQAKQWQNGQCRYCQAPYASKEALFCFQCGAKLAHQSGEIQQWMPESQERHTDPLQVQPILGARQKALARTETQEIPSVRLRKGE